MKTVLKSTASVYFCVVNQLAGHNLIYCLIFTQKQTGKNFSSQFGVKVGTGKVDWTVTELWFLHSTSPTQHPNLSAHFKAWETAGTVCLCGRMCVYGRLCHHTFARSFLWIVVTHVSQNIVSAWYRRGEGSKWQRDKKRVKVERQADRETEEGRQTGGQLRVVTDGMKSMSTCTPLTHTRTIV